MPTISGMNFGGDFLGMLEALEKQGRKFCGEKLAEEFAEVSVGNFPKFCHAIAKKNSTQNRSAEPRSQLIKDWAR